MPNHPGDPPTPYHKNVPGPFYVEDWCCLTCGIPDGVAPNNFAWDEDWVQGQCYVIKQPETPDELDRVIEAVGNAEIDCIRYRGSDPEIQRRIRDVSGECDTPEQAALSVVMHKRAQRVEREKRKREPREVARFTCSDGLHAVVIREWAKDQHDFRELQLRDVGGGRNAWLPLRTSRFYYGADTAEGAAKAEIEWMGREVGPGSWDHQMRISARVTAPDAVLFLHDPGAVHALRPSVEREPIAASPACVSMRTARAETLVDLGRSFRMVDGDIVLRTVIETPTKNVAVTDALGTVILSREVYSARTKVTIWANGDAPDHIMIST